MPRRATPERKPKAQGENIEEWQRHTERIVLRLPPETATQLRARAEAEGQTLSGYVARLIAIDLSVV